MCGVNKLKVSKQTQKFVHSFGVNYYKKIGGMNFNVGYHKRDETKIGEVNPPSHASGVWTTAIIFDNKILMVGDQVRVDGEVRTLESEEKTTEYFREHGKHDRSLITFTMAGVLYNIPKAKVEVISYSYEIEGDLYDFSEIVNKPIER